MSVDAPVPPNPGPATPGRGEDLPASGLIFEVARTLEDVVEAWSLVQRCYAQQGLIAPNPTGIHAMPEAIRPDVAVITGRLRGEVCSTMTAMIGTGPLPLQKVYAEEIEALVAAGRRLMEVGLFADRRANMVRKLPALLELMRYCSYFGLNAGVTDVIVGVHPHHTGFYQKLFNFQPAGEIKSYEVVSDRPVELLRCPTDQLSQTGRLPRGLTHIRDHPVDPAEYAQRFGLHMDVVADSPIGAFLRHREAQQRSAA